MKIHSAIKKDKFKKMVVCIEIHRLPFKLQ